MLLTSSPPPIMILVSSGARLLKITWLSSEVLQTLIIKVSHLISWLLKRLPTLKLHTNSFRQLLTKRWIKTSSQKLSVIWCQISLSLVHHSQLKTTWPTLLIEWRYISLRPIGRRKKAKKMYPNKKWPLMRLINYRMQWIFCLENNRSKPIRKTELNLMHKSRILTRVIMRTRIHVS